MSRSTQMRFSHIFNFWKLARRSSSLCLLTTAAQRHSRLSNLLLRKRINRSGSEKPFNSHKPNIWRNPSNQGEKNEPFQENIVCRWHPHHSDFSLRMCYESCG